MNPYVTILMPVYNSEMYLPESIESILHQTFRDFELLIIYDESTDHSLDVLTSYNDTRIRIKKNSTRLGLIASLNKGLGLAKGKYVVRMDADDIALPERLEKQVAFMDANPEIGISGTWLVTIGLIEDVWSLPTIHEDIVAGMFFEPYLFHPTVIMRRETLLTLQEFYDEGYKYAEDAEYWVRLERRGVKFANIGEILLKHRFHESNISQVHVKIQNKNSDRLICNHLVRLGIEPTQKEYLLFKTLRHGNSSDLHRLEEVSKFIEILLSANAATGIFSGPALKKVLARRWFRLCFKSAGYGIPVWQKYYEAPISRCIKLTYTQRGLFLLKCLLRRNRLSDIKFIRRRRNLN